ncbi:hypothetical protein [Dactylosporangium darangshiense]|uniref:Transposase n=1 Tax=Dactylosporangium darangshiense TaxID=579108 RepID=A0ABP8DV40_9ACTN
MRFTTGAIRVEPDRKHVVLPRLGRLKLHESIRKLARRLDNGTARIMSATVRRDGGRWHLAFCAEVERADRIPARPGSVVGVDVGITHLAVLSTGSWSTTRAAWPARTPGFEPSAGRWPASKARTAGPRDARRAGGSVADAAVRLLLGGPHSSRCHPGAATARHRVLGCPLWRMSSSGSRSPAFGPWRGRLGPFTDSGLAGSEC